MADHLPAAESDRPALGALAPVVGRWPLLLLLAAAGGVAAFLWFSTKPPVYESTTRVQVSKRYEPTGGEGRVMFIEDYVATMSQIIVSDVVLKDAHRALKAAGLTVPVPDDETAGLDALKAALGITRVRDPNAAATSSSSVLSLRVVAGDPGDAKKILDAVNVAVQRHLERGVAEALKKERDAVDQSIAAKGKLKAAAEGQLIERKNELSGITTEDLVVVRGRVTANRERSFSLQLELIVLARDLKAVEAAGKNPAARQAKLRQLLGTARTGDPTATPESLLAQLSARRLELTERVGKDHPVMKELDAQILFHRNAAGQLSATPEADELSLYEGRLKERKEAAEAQLQKVDAEVDAAEKVLRRGGVVQDQVELLRRQVDEYNLDINRQKDRQEALTASIAAKESTRAYTAEVLDEPRVGRKIGPSLLTWVIPGLLLGLCAGVGLAYLAEIADQGFRSPAEIRRRLGVPVFGHVPPIRLNEPATADVSAAYDPSLVVARRPKSAEAETYRGVRAQVLVASAAAGHKVIQITSPNPGDGKSTTAANLAVALAQTGKRVLLVDCDFRKPRVHKLFALAGSDVGLASVVDGATALDTAVRPCDVDNLFLLPCGPRPANPAELLAGDRFAQVLAALKAGYDHVVLDTPPLLVISDPLVVAQRADAVVLVFGLNRRSRPQVERAKELLADSGATLLGVVVNGMNLPAGGYGYSSSAHKYGYNYEYQYADPYGDPDDRPT